jgi:hypothetical protein
MRRRRRSVLLLRRRGGRRHGSRLVSVGDGRTAGRSGTGSPAPAVQGALGRGVGAGDRGADQLPPPTAQATAASGVPVAGTGGSLRRYRVVVEAGTGQDPATFAATVDAVLADPRS